MLTTALTILPIHAPLEIGLFLGPVILYAEMHYRLRFLRGRLFKKLPEVIFDTPRRIQTDHLPVVLLIKDAHWFPIALREVSLTITSPFDPALCEKQVFTENMSVDRQWFTREYYLDVARYRDHLLNIDCTAIVECHGRHFQIRNDNYAGLSHAPFRVFIDSEALPSENGWQWGDLHCHSSWTSDQVEFGLPPVALPDLAAAMGLSFCGLTEHSYDLDDQPDSWTKNDPQLRKWNEYRVEIESVNAARKDFIIIPGEEASVDNGLGRNVHLAVLNNREFFRGSGDGLEKSLGFPSEFSYQQILQKADPRALIFAAHPLTRPPFSQWLIARRGVWNRHDHHSRLDGWQILNGQDGREVIEGKNFWVSKLLAGSQSYLYAGNDAHGNFNRFRQIRLPLLNLYEHERQVFGEFLTGVRTDGNQGLDQLVARLKSGPVIVSNGPFINLVAMDTNRRRFEIGKTMQEPPAALEITALSSRHFGAIRRIKILAGDLLKRRETLCKTFEFIQGVNCQTITLPVENQPSIGYFRAEIETQSAKFGLTNPIWFGKFK